MEHLELFFIFHSSFHLLTSFNIWKLFSSYFSHLELFLSHFLISGVMFCHFFFRFSDSKFFFSISSQLADLDKKELWDKDGIFRWVNVVYLISSYFCTFASFTSGVVHSQLFWICGGWDKNYFPLFRDGFFFTPGNLFWSFYTSWAVKVVLIFHICSCLLHLLIHLEENL